MAVKTEVIVTLTDDIDGGEATESIRFGWHNRVYDLDLSKEHAEEIAGRLDVWAEKGTVMGKVTMGKPGTKLEAVTGTTTTAAPAGQAPRGTASARSAEARAQSGRVRAWAKKNGIKVQDRGRIPASVENAYFDANPDDPRIGGTEPPAPDDSQSAVSAPANSGE